MYNIESNTDWSWAASQTKKLKESKAELDKKVAQTSFASDFLVLEIKDAKKRYLECMIVPPAPTFEGAC